MQTQMDIPISSLFVLNNKKKYETNLRTKAMKQYIKHIKEKNDKKAEEKKD